MKRFWTAVCACASLAIAGEVSARTLRVDLRSRVEAFRGSGTWQEVHFPHDLPVAKSAIVICDVWDKHWCSGASRRVDALAVRMAPFIEKARAQGIQIVHAPSEVMDFYKEVPQRQRMLETAKIQPMAILHLTD